MEKLIRINIYNMIGHHDAISIDDGEKIYSKIKKLMENGYNIILDFNNITHIITAFLNIAYGRLFGQFDSKLIEKHIKFENISDEDLQTIKRVRNNAIHYFLKKSKEQTREE